VRSEYSLNEGGGDRVVFGRPLYLCSTAEKMSAPFRLRVFGRSGHASMPGVADNALIKAARLIERLAEYRPAPRHSPETGALMAAITGGEVPPADHAVARAREVHPLAATLVEPLLSLTLSPTMISASQKRNVIPAVCEVTVDCRLLPGQPPSEAEAEIRRVLGDAEYELHWIEHQGGTRSVSPSPLWNAVASFVRELEPEAEVVPICVAGFTDSHWMREAFGTISYGFFPMRTMDPEVAALLIHSADERIHVDDLELGVEFFRHAARYVGALT
jgi:acetylornithine deacetylase/succinyl-diaminopimelate desuccinylase-like protein